MPDAIEQFRDAILAAGIEPPKHIVADGKIHRFSTNDNRKDDAGWYLLHLDGLAAGAFGDWRSSISETWCAASETTLTAEQRIELQQFYASARSARGVEQQRIWTEAADKAKRLWRAATKAKDDFPYLVKKRVKSYGLKSDNGCLLVPVKDKDHRLRSLQFIDANGKKLFLEGGRAGGGYFVIGRAPKKLLYLVEGYATGATVYEATGTTVVVAFNSGNLPSAAKTLREKFPGIEIVICADDDHHISGNPGLTKAKVAAAQIGAKIAVPEFGENRPEKATDFNDMAAHLGLDKVAEFLRTATLPKTESKEDCGGEAKIAALAGLREFAYQRCRVSEAKALGITVAMLDKLVRRRRAEAENKAAALPHWHVDPWDRAVSCAELLDDIEKVFCRYIVLPKGASEALALWTLHAWTMDAGDISPFLVLISPTKRCGKTSVLIILYYLTPRSELASNISASAIFRYVQETRPTLLIDDPVMSVAEICALPVTGLAAEHCVLFLWTTVPLLERAFEVLSAWGFTYASGAVWDKEVAGMGYWFRGQHELLLLATKGNPPLPPTENVPASVIRERRREHSRKPEAAYAMIERIFPDLPKLELFARQARPGWEVWGNEVNKFDNGYDVQDDVTKSFDAAYEAIRQRVAKGGPGWVPK